jgi:predicted permease
MSHNHKNDDDTRTSTLPPEVKIATMASLIASMHESLPPISLLTGSSAAFGAAGKAMAELGVAGCIGATCVQRGLLTADMVRTLSKTTFAILLPMFLGTSIVKTVATYGLTRSSLGVPLLAVTHAFLLFLLSKQVLVPMFGMDSATDEGKSATVSCAWGNAGVVPLIFAEALFRHQPELLAQCYAQVSLFLVGWSPFFWSFARSVLIGNDDNDGNTQTSTTASEAGDTHTSMIASRLGGLHLKRLFPPPVVGVMTGLVLAISPLRPLIVSTGSERAAPLGVIYNSFQNLGRAANPLALLVLTSSLAIGANGSSNKEGVTVDVDDSVQHLHPFSRWACVSTSRFIVSPMLMLALLKGMSKIGMIGKSKADPMLWFVLLLESCMPPAQNTVLMLQVADKGAEASRMAKFLFSSYATAMLPVVVIVTMALRALELA